jgi:hypothetical protein
LGNASTIEIYEALRNNHVEIVRFGADVDEALSSFPECRQTQVGQPVPPRSGSHPVTWSVTIGRKAGSDP